MHALRMIAFVLVVAALRAQEVPELVARLAAAESLDEATVGEDGGTSETYRTYERLRDRATVAELAGLLRHARPVVRGYAARALAEIGAETDWRALVIAHVADTEAMRRHSGCCLMDEPYGDYLFGLVRERGLLGEEAMADVAEHLVRAKSPLFAREWCLRNLRFRDGMLHEIRDLAKAGDGPALIALARYGLAGDVPVVLERLAAATTFADNCACLAAALLRDRRVLPALGALEPAARATLDNDVPARLRFWLAAIAAQRSPEAAAALLRVARWPVADPVRREGLRATLSEVLAPHADVAVFGELRALLAK